jgi:hypothetical protein
VSRAEELKLGPTILQRQRKIPRRLEEGCSATGHQFGTPEEYYRSIFNQVVDQILTSLRNRFQKKVIDHLSHMERFLISNVDVKDVVQFYKEDFNIAKLTLHRDMFLDIAESQDCTISSVSNVVDFLSDAKNKHILTMISEYVRFLKTVLTIPVTSCTCERSFSGLRRLKSYLRSTMGQKRLNNVAVLHIHRDLTELIDTDAIANQFIEKTAVRRSTFQITK